MLNDLKKYREQGFPDAMLMNFAKLRIEYHKLPVDQRETWDFDYFMRMKLIEYLRKNS